jgi:putative hemolysin
VILLSLAAFVLLGAFSISLAIVEACFYLLKRRRLGHVAYQNSRAELANRYLDDPPSLLMPIHMGAFVAHVSMTLILAFLLMDVIAQWALLWAFVVMVAYLLVFRLALPYSLVRRAPERALLVVLPFVHRYVQLVDPVVARLRRRAEQPRHEELASGEAPAPKSQPEVPPPPVREEDELRLIEAVERFSQTVVRNVMTPRPDIVMLPARATLSEARRLIADAKFSRLPVYGENVDDIVGFVGVRDLVQCGGVEGEPIAGFVRPVHMVPETKKVSELLKELQARCTMLAVVIDEYGAVAGLATMEDLVEELVGEIQDEYDTESEPMVVEPDGALLLSARCNLDRVEQALESSLREGEGVATVGGLVAEVFGRIPRVGERIEHDGFLLEVVAADRRRVTRVRIRRLSGGPQ